MSERYWRVAILPMCRHRHTVDANAGPGRGRRAPLQLLTLIALLASAPVWAMPPGTGVIAVSMSHR